jgi:hypothetical protein
MECLDCPLKYIGQTGRTLNTRYKEHIHAIRSNNSNKGYASHILNTGHRYGTIEHNEDHKSRKERKTPQYIREILHT